MTRKFRVCAASERAHNPLQPVHLGCATAHCNANIFKVKMTPPVFKPANSDRLVPNVGGNPLNSTPPDAQKCRSAKEISKASVRLSSYVYLSIMNCSLILIKHEEIFEYHKRMSRFRRKTVEVRNLTADRKFSCVHPVTVV